MSSESSSEEDVESLDYTDILAKLREIRRQNKRLRKEKSELVDINMQWQAETCDQQNKIDALMKEKEDLERQIQELKNTSIEKTNELKTTDVPVKMYARKAKKLGPFKPKFASTPPPKNPIVEVVFTDSRVAPKPGSSTAWTLKLAGSMKKKSKSRTVKETEEEFPSDVEATDDVKSNEDTSGSSSRRGASKGGKKLGPKKSNKSSSRNAVELACSAECAEDEGLETVRKAVKKPKPSTLKAKRGGSKTSSTRSAPKKQKVEDEEEEEEEQEDTEWEVERILNVKTVNKKREFLVKWKGFPVSSSTWEPEEGLHDARDAVEDFVKKQARAKTSRKKKARPGISKRLVQSAVIPKRPLPAGGLPAFKKGKDGKFRCPVCAQKAFSYSQGIRQHVESHFLWICEICKPSLNLSNRSSYARHIRRKHSSTESSSKEAPKKEATHAKTLTPAKPAAAATAAKKEDSSYESSDSEEDEPPKKAATPAAKPAAKPAPAKKAEFSSEESHSSEDETPATTKPVVTSTPAPAKAAPVKRKIEESSSEESSSDEEDEARKKGVAIPPPAKKPATAVKGVAKGKKESSSEESSSEEEEEAPKKSLVKPAPAPAKAKKDEDSSEVESEDEEDEPKKAAPTPPNSVKFVKGNKDESNEGNELTEEDFAEDAEVVTEAEAVGVIEEDLADRGKALMLKLHHRTRK